MKVVMKWDKLPLASIEYDDDYKDLMCFGISMNVWKEIEGEEVFCLRHGIYSVFYKEFALSMPDRYVVEVDDEQPDSDVA